MDCYQNFCRLLGRLKANYQLSELVRTDGYEEWLKLAAEFAVQSFSQMHVRWFSYTFSPFVRVGFVLG